MSGWWLDHIVWGSSDLASLTATFADHTGVEPSAGGRHLLYGTRNALVGLGDGLYLELIGPDPDRECESEFYKRFSALAAPTVTGWCIRTSSLAATAEILRSIGIAFEEPSSVSRVTPDGGSVKFAVLRPVFSIGEAMPFFIDWLDTPHPSSVAAGGCRLAAFEVHHPECALLRQLCSNLQLNVVIEHADVPRFAGTIVGPAGQVCLAG